MKCEVCGSDKSVIQKSDTTDFHGKFYYTLRKRKCKECGNVYHTVEMPALSAPFANPAMLRAIRQLAKASRDALRMAEATEHFLIKEEPNGR